MFEQPCGNLAYSQAGGVRHRLGSEAEAFAKYQPYTWPMDVLVVAYRAG